MENDNRDIGIILDTLNEIHFDSIILIFGFGEYLDIIAENIVSQNKVYIFDLDDSSKGIDKYNVNEQIFIVPFEEELVREILSVNISVFNYLNIYVVEYSDYSKKYKEKYDEFIEILDDSFYKMRLYDNTLEGFKELHLYNTLSNIKHLNKSSSIDEYIYINKDVPALIVSGGPSLDKNIFDLARVKDKLDKFFIIAGNRTVLSLMVNGITPDLIVSVDPQYITYEMLQNYLHLDIPLIYYEETNSEVVDKHKGTKIVTSIGIYNTFEGIDRIAECFKGGSVAHTSADIAVALGCNPIIFLGQDFAYTYDKEHAIYATHKMDIKAFEQEAKIIDTDVRGNEVKTSILLRSYKRAMEYFIDIYSKEGIEFYNCSYGANIKGATHKELNSIINDEKYNKYKKQLPQLKLLKVNQEKIKNDSIIHIENTISKIDDLLEKCKNILENKYENHLDDEMIIAEVLMFIAEFTSDSKNRIFSSYIENFLITVQSKYFQVDAKDYETKSTDMKYQGDIFTKYLNDLKETLKMIDEIIKKIL